jgi:4-amino-4-deoxy-L-arabinose transferase-like glycosyltransferase
LRGWRLSGEEGSLNKRADSSPYRFIIRLGIIAAIGVVISLIASHYCRHPALRFDENYYYLLAESIAKGHYEEGYVVRAPLYPLLLAVVFKMFGPGFWSALVVQSLLRGVTIFGVGYLGRRFLTDRAGLLAAGLVTVYPAMISGYIRFMTEVLYVPVFVLSYYLLERTLRNPSLVGSLKAGAASGAATLVRSVSLMFTLVMAVWLLVRKPPGGRSWRRNVIHAGVLVGAMLAVVSPWAIRNALSPTGFVLVSNDAAFNLWLITSGKSIKEATPEWLSWGTQAQRQTEAYRRWWGYLKEDPAFHLRRIAEVLPRLVDHRWDSPVGALSKVRHGPGLREVPALRRFLDIFHPVTFYLVLGGGILGVGALERDSTRRNLMLLAVLYFILIHGVTLSRARFLLPIQVLLAIYAGGLIDSGLSRLGLTMPGRRRRL